MKPTERIASLEEQTKAHESWLKHLEGVLEGAVQDLAGIKVQVHNHIPSQIEDLKSLVKWVIGLWVTSLLGVIGYLLSRR